MSVRSRSALAPVCCSQFSSERPTPGGPDIPKDLRRVGSLSSSATPKISRDSFVHASARLRVIQNFHRNRDSEIYHSLVSARNRTQAQPDRVFDVCMACGDGSWMYANSRYDKVLAAGAAIPTSIPVLLRYHELGNRPCLLRSVSVAVM